MHPATIISIILLFIFVILIAYARFCLLSDGHAPIKIIRSTGSSGEKLT